MANINIYNPQISLNMIKLNPLWKTDKIVEFYISVPAITISLILSILWTVYFVKRIIYFIKLYRECIQKAQSDPFMNFIEAARHHKSEIIKYIFLLLINIVEFGFITIYSIGRMIANNFDTYEHLYSPDRASLHNCSRKLVNSNIFDLRLMYENPINSILVTTGQVGIMTSLALGICVMKYLHEIMHNIEANPYPYIRRLLLITGLVALYLMITGTVPQLMIVHYLTEPIVQLVYICIWVKQARIFHRTLKWRTVEFQVRGRHQGLVRRSKVNSHQFALIMCSVGVAYACFILGECIGQYFSLFALTLYYGPCMFHYLYGTPNFDRRLSTQRQTEHLDVVFLTSASASLMLFVIGGLLIVIQYILSTVLFFGKILSDKLKFRCGRIRTRFTPNLTQHLLTN